jgi:hypothetical protein
MDVGMSAFGTKRTLVCVATMSALEVKRRRPLRLRGERVRLQQGLFSNPRTGDVGFQGTVECRLRCNDIRAIAEGMNISARCYFKYDQRRLAGALCYQGYGGACAGDGAASGTRR